MSLKHGRANGQYDRQPGRFLDGCHRWNWIISPILSALLSLAMFAHYMGGVSSNIESLQRDILLLKQEVFQLAHGRLNEEAFK